MASFSFDRLNVVGILIWTIIIVTVLGGLYAEYRDVRCTNYKDGRCGYGFGSSYAEGRPHHHDSVDTLLKKVRTTARYEVNSISWRRCFIAAVVSAFLVLYIAKKKVPTGLQIGTAIVVVYLVFYLTMGSFQQTVTQPALSQLDRILHLLQKKVNR